MDRVDAAATDTKTWEAAKKATIVTQSQLLAAAMIANVSTVQMRVALEMLGLEVQDT